MSINDILFSSMEFWARFSRRPNSPVIVQAKIAGFWTEPEGRIPYINVRNSTAFHEWTVDVSVSDFADKWDLHLLPNLYPRNLTLLWGLYQDEASALSRSRKLITIGENR